MYFYRIENLDYISNIKKTSYYNKKINHRIDYKSKQIYGLYFFKEKDEALKQIYNDSQVLVRFKKEKLSDYIIYDDTEWGIKNISFYVDFGNHNTSTIIDSTDIQKYDCNNLRWINL